MRRDLAAIAWVLLCVLFSVFLTSLIACSGGGSQTRTPPALVSISVTPPTPTVTAGQTQQFKATGSYSDGSSSDITTSVTWSTGSVDIATINSVGLLTAVAAGTTTVSASSGSLSGSVNLSVKPSLVSIAITPGAPSIAAGLTQQFAATGTYSDNSTAVITSSVTWESATTSVATIDAAGQATSTTQGTTLITASSGTVSASVTLTVTAPALTSIAISPATATLQMGAATPLQFSATGTYTDNSTEDLTDSVIWSTVNSWVASINTSGAAGPLRAGYTAISAASGSIQAMASLTVLANPRYLYVDSAAGRDITRMAVNAGTGQPVFEGYQLTGNYQNIGINCVTTDPSQEHLYATSQVGSASSPTGLVNVYTINATTGALTPNSGNPFSVSVDLGCPEFLPADNFAYAISELGNSGNQLAAYSVGGDGSLTQTNTLTLPYTPQGLTVDPLGQYVYLVVANSTQPNGLAFIYGYQVDPDTGALTALQNSPWSLPATSAGSLSFHPSGNFLYFANLSGNNISQFAVDRATGNLTSLGADATLGCTNPVAIQFSPDGAQAYATCESTGSLLQIFSVGSNGLLTPVTTPALSAGAVPYQILADPSGQYVYIVGSGIDTSGNYAATNTVSAYQVNADGSATLVGNFAGQVLAESITLVGGANAVQWTPTYAYVTTAGDNKITPYQVKSDGTLTAMTSLATQTGPFSATTLPWGSDVLVATQAAAPNLDAYTPGSGGLTAGTQFGFAGPTGGLVIDPRGDFGYATDPSSGLVYEYFGGSPGYWTGEYQAVTDDPYTYTAAAGAGPITMDPSGRYLIVANQTAQSISLFEPAGAAPTTPTALSFTPLAITMDPSGNFLFVGGNDGQFHMLWSDGLGDLTDVADATLAGNNTASVAVEQSGHFVYAAGPAGLNGFSYNTQKNTLTALTLNIPVSLLNATGVFIDPSGKYLYVAVSGSGTNALYLFSINSDGTLTASSSNPVATPNDATSMVFSATVQ
jgi:6-phosphogluconolactonase (cycloisomerase 2 family)